MTEPLLNYQQAAAILGISQGTLQNWVFQKKFPYVKVGSLTRFLPADIEDYIRANRVEAQENKPKK